MPLRGKNITVLVSISCIRLYSTVVQHEEWDRYLHVYHSEQNYMDCSTPYMSKLSLHSHLLIHSVD